MQGSFSPLPSILIQTLMGDTLGKRFSHGIVFSKPNITTRLAVIISRRVDKRATKRNRMKRLVKTSFRLLKPRGDFVVVVKKALPDTEQDVQHIIKTIV